jgi:glycerophosphoryl diester phosphodiesterase
MRDIRPIKHVWAPLIAALSGLPSTALNAADRIAVIAHRGGHRAHPENTLPAFQAAIDARADFFELDLKTELSAQL